MSRVGIFLITFGWLMSQPHPLASQSFRPYSAREGETLNEVAQRFSISLPSLLAVNPGIRSDQVLFNGEVLLIPVSNPPDRRQNRGGASGKPAKAASSQRQGATAFWIYRVQPSESLQTIAQKFGMSVESLASANGLRPDIVVVPGQILQVPVFSISNGETSLASGRSSTVSGQTASQNARDRLHQAGGKDAFGKIGVVVGDVAAIYSRPTVRARIWSRCGKGTRVIVTDQLPDWWGILMVNGATGWIKKTAVQVSGQAVSWTDVFHSLTGGSPDSLQSVVRDALRYLGIPYRFGGQSVTTGMDCSAFVRTVFASRGFYLPRTSRDQVQYGKPVSPSDLRPGDRLYFAGGNGVINHTGIYLGNGLFIHASGRHGVVTISSLSEPAYARSLVAIRR